VSLLIRVISSVVALLFGLDLAAFAIIGWLLAFGFRESDTATYLIIPASITFSVAATVFLYLAIHLLFCKIEKVSQWDTSKRPSIGMRAVGCIVCATAGACLGLVAALTSALLFHDARIGFAAFNVLLSLSAITGAIFPIQSTEMGMNVLDTFRSLAAKATDIIGG